MEFALLAPLLFTLLLGIIQYGIALNRAQSLQAAAREAGRIVSMPGATKTDGLNKVTLTLNGTTFDSGPVISFTPNVTSPCANRSGLNVTVLITATADVSLPLYTATSNLTGTGTFVCE